MNKLPVNKNFIFLLTFFFLLCTATLRAQDRRISLEGTSFTVGALLDEIEAQTDIRISNRSEAIDYHEVIGCNVSAEMLRDAVDQVLGGTPYVFQSSNTYMVISIERRGTHGRIIQERVFVDINTGRVTKIDNVYGTRELGVMNAQLAEIPVGKVFDRDAYTYRSNGIYTVITVTVQDEQGNNIQRQIIVDAATGRPVTLEDILDRYVESIDDEPAQFFSFPGVEYFPRWAVKTNLLYGATTTPNIGFEFFLNRYLTLDISGGLNPFVYSDNKKFVHWMVQPTLRYWIQEPFNGHFIGTSLMYSNFNVGGINLPGNIMNALGKYRFRGDAYAASFQYGHQWLLSPRWAIEASLNVGYMYLNYRKYECGWCGEFLGTERVHYLGPTNTSLSLIYIIR